MAERIDWARLLGLGLGRLGLRPDEFWSLTPAELFVMAGIGGAGASRMTRAALAALEARFAARGGKGGGGDGGK